VNKIGRVLLAAVVAGLALSIMGTLARLIATPLTVDVEPFFKNQNFQMVLLGFFFDLVTGFFYVLAYVILKGGRRESFWKEAGLFWLLLLLVGVVPRAADVYRYFQFPNRLVLAWLVSWAIEALVVTVLIVLLFRKPKLETGSRGNALSEGSV
jgi:hypothetical protein